MKKINSLLTGLLLTATVLLTQQATAQAPQKMSYQSVLRNSSNALLVNTQVRVRISVLQGTASGTAVYVETQLATTNGNGLVSLQIGTGTATTGTFAGINWAAGPYFIKTETDPAGGTNYSITGTQEMLSVPYAMYAAKSGDAITMGAIGGLSSANGGTITAGVLRLTPADASNAGLVTTGTQTFAGSKTFSSAITITAGAPGAGKVLTSDAAGLAGWANSRGFATAGPGISVTGTGTSIDPYIVSTKIYTIGLWPELGGYVFRISADGRHGLVAETQNEYSSGVIWWAAKNNINDPSTLSLNGRNFMDWRLPTVGELTEMFTQRAAIGNFLISFYWSSSEPDANNAFAMAFSDGQYFSSDKNNSSFFNIAPIYARAVRAF